jgi:putative Holliday junction resolvase
VGTVRIGLAKSDPGGLLATPVRTLPREVDGSDKQLIAAAVAEQKTAVVYVGYPLNMDGTAGESAADARAYAEAIAKLVAPVPVRLVDERLSTVSAHRALHAAGRASRNHRSVVDQVAAVTILQAALDAEASGSAVGELIEESL